ncbi:hypothetical protein SFMTTN_0288 [Sulfuriferula multivorans]|uniref:Uncharacterized protein n=1 Tax=Sulfuriferula multivorans TaxID=1559896 RepID=A0A401JA32_9PROT|nr:hypothetical protein SFMTTN_0288 [Sulfuriferula multivorans]
MVSTKPEKMVPHNESNGFFTDLFSSGNLLIAAGEKYTSHTIIIS